MGGNISDKTNIHLAVGPVVALVAPTSSSSSPSPPLCRILLHSLSPSSLSPSVASTPRLSAPSRQSSSLASLLCLRLWHQPHVCPSHLARAPRWRPFRQPNKAIGVYYWLLHSLCYSIFSVSTRGINLTSVRPISPELLVGVRSDNPTSL